MTSERSKSYKVEYLSTINSDGDFCTNISSFCSLLESYEKLKIEGNKLFWGDKEFFLEIYDGTILNSNHKFFHLKIINSNNENKTDFLSVLRVIRTIVSKVNNNQPPEILWDDISSEYAVQAYPVIHELENLMRKLITKFMITKVGLSWTKDNIPKEVSESIRNTNTSKKQNYIYDTDFIQLSNFLFKDYTTANAEEFVDKIKKAKNVNELNLDDLKKIVPLSNWTRYFNPIVECTSDELSTKWDKLYKLRCKVAHNNFMDEEDFNNLIINSNAVKSIIQNAIDNLDQVSIKEEEKEELAENAAINLNKMYGEFVLKWKDLINIINSITPFFSNSVRAYTGYDGVNYLFKAGYVTENELNKFEELKNLRNLIVHDSNFELNEMALNSALKDLVLLEKKLAYIASIGDYKTGIFEINETVDGHFRLVLKAPHGLTLLIGESLKTKDAAMKLAELIKINASSSINFELNETTTGKYYFNLKENSKRILATSIFFSDEISRRSTIELVKNYCQTAKIIDLT